MTISQLRYFQAVCNYGSITKASEILHVSQPTISIAISNLEAEFSTMLFLRNNKRLTLSDAGHFLLLRVNNILAEIDLLYSQISSFDKDQQSLRVSVVPVGISNSFPVVFEKFRNTFPDTKITVIESSAEKAIYGIKDNLYDLSFTVALPQKPDFIDGLILYKTSCVFCVSKSHPLASKSECTFSDLASQSFILSHSDSYLTKQIMQRFSKLGITPKISLYSVQFSLISKILAAGRDGALLTQQVASNISNIIQIPIKDPICVAHTLIWGKRPILSRNIINFISTVREFYPYADPYL